MIVNSARKVVENDLDHIAFNLKEELPRLAGKQLLITGGAGFPGHYLIQAITHWNRSAATRDAIHLTVLDNFVRGIPDWLTRSKGERHLALAKHDVTHPLPSGMQDFQYEGNLPFLCGG